MKKYAETKNYVLYHSDMNKMEEDIKENSIDAIITDPPYGLTSIVKRFGKEDSAPAKFGKDGAFSRLSKGFMGKEWDGSGVEYSVEAWQHCYNVLKPGGYLLAFGGSRTFHRIACAIEDAGFEIRDTIMWIYGSGFPKSTNIGTMLDKKNGVESKVVGIGKSGAKETHTNSLNLVKNPFGGEYEKKEAQNEWNGWGSCLKPAYEPIIVARKPFKGSLIDNVVENRVGGLNIDECRIPLNGETIAKNVAFKEEKQSDGWGTKKCITELDDRTGRFPANVILTYDENNFEEVCSGFPDTKSPKNGLRKSEGYNSNCYGKGIGIQAGMNNGEYGDSGSAARYFYCAKASKKDRNEGLEEFANVHPTVKPTELMQYLVRLVTPKGGTIMDCFMGSGSTGKAVMYENKERNADYKFIGIEMTEEYLPICEARIKNAAKEDFNLFNMEEGEQNV